jgi:hypothetical protein
MSGMVGRFRAGGQPKAPDVRCRWPVIFGRQQRYWTMAPASPSRRCRKPLSLRFVAAEGCVCKLHVVEHRSIQCSTPIHAMHLRDAPRKIRRDYPCTPFCPSDKYGNPPRPKGKLSQNARSKPGPAIECGSRSRYLGTLTKRYDSMTMSAPTPE